MMKISRVYLSKLARFLYAPASSELTELLTMRGRGNGELSLGPSGEHPLCTGRSSPEAYKGSPGEGPHSWVLPEVLTSPENGSTYILKHQSLSPENAARPTAALTQPRLPARSALPSSCLSWRQAHRLPASLRWSTHRQERVTCVKQLVRAFLCLSRRLRA